MQVDVFDFELDRDLIAKEPVSPRDHSRLLDLSEPGIIRDRHFYDLPDLLNPGDVLVFNDTKVIPARLYGAHGEARVEVTLYRPVDGINWWAFVKNSKRLRPGDIVTFYCQEIPAESSDFQAIVIEKKEDDGVMLQFGCQPQHLGAKLEQYGSMPLPPYIKRENRAPAFGTVIMTRKTTKPSMPNTKAPSPLRLPGCISRPGFWTLFAKKAFEKCS